MNAEAENHKSATVKILNDLAVLHGNMLIMVSKQKSLIFKRICFHPYVFFLAQQSTTF